jgi:hypothetical protein
VALEKRLYEEEFSTDLPPDAVKATVPGASNSHTITAKGTQDGVTYTTGVTSFADGPFLYVVFAGGAGGAVDPQAVLSAGAMLLGAVQGRPAA